MMHRQRIAIASTILAAAAAAPAAADWLVLAGGDKIETRGPWEVRGGLIVFTSTSGTLSSLRASEVDLAASERATEQAQRSPAQPAPAPRPKAKVVLTDKDLPPVARSLGGEGDAESGTDPAAPANAAPPLADDARLAVAGWDVTTPDDYDGTMVTGRLRNVSGRLLTRVALDVTVYSASGTQLARTSAYIEPGPVAPDRIVDFEARFPGLYDVTTARFDARGVGFLEGGAEGGGAAAGAPEEGAEGLEGVESMEGAESMEEPEPGA